MKTERYTKLLEILSKNSLFIEYLKAIETYLSDIRTLETLDIDKIKGRQEALKIFREYLLDKLLILSGEKEPPENDEWK